MKRNKFLKSLDIFKIYDFSLSVQSSEVLQSEDQVVVNWQGSSFETRNDLVCSFSQENIYDGGLSVVSSSTTEPSPFNIYYRTRRLTYLYPSTFISTTLRGRQIKEIGFYCISAPVNHMPFPGYTVKIKSSPNNSLFGGDATSPQGMTTIFGPSNFTPVSNSWNMFQLSEPYFFSPEHNSLVIEICWSQIQTNFASQGTILKMNISSEVLSRGYESDDGAGSGCIINLNSSLSSIPYLRVISS